MTDITLFPFAQYWWFYLAFLAGVLVLLALDLGLFHREAHEVSFREAATWSAIWVSLALAFNYGLYQFALWKFPQDPRLVAIPGFDAAAAAKETALQFLAMPSSRSRLRTMRRIVAASSTTNTFISGLMIFRRSSPQ